RIVVAEVTVDANKTGALEGGQIFAALVVPGVLQEQIADLPRNDRADGDRETQNSGRPAAFRRLCPFRRERGANLIGPPRNLGGARFWTRHCYHERGGLAEVLQKCRRPRSVR